MITVFVNKCNRFNQRFYDDVITGLPMHSLRCTCGHAGCLSRHAYYYRTVKFLSESVRLRVLRLVCSFCGKTHAVLLSMIVPYSQIILEDQRDIITASESGSPMSDIFQRNLCLDENNAASVIRSFRRHWKQRLKSSGISLLEDPTIPCFSHYSRQFMQIKKTPNLLFLSPT